MSFSCRVTVIMKWKDVRLFYNNLFNGSTALNKEEVDQIWIPPLILKNSLELQKITKSGIYKIQILKQNEGFYKNEKDLHEGITYDGKSNEIVMTAVFDNNFICSYQLHDYPFDSQICTIDLSSPTDIRNDIILVPGTIKYSGFSKILPQFILNISEHF